MLSRRNGGCSEYDRKRLSVHWDDSRYEPVNVDRRINMDKHDLVNHIEDDVESLHDYEEDNRTNDETSSYVNTDMSSRTTTTHYTDIEDLGSDYYSLWTQEDYFMYYYGDDV